MISLPCSKQSIKIRPSGKVQLPGGFPRGHSLNWPQQMCATELDQGTQFQYYKCCVFLDQKPLARV